MSKIEKVLATGKTHTTASGASGAGVGARRQEELLDIRLSSPGAKPVAELSAVQAHPTAEQLFAGAWSACYSGALGLAAKARRVALPADLAVDVEVDLGQTGQAFYLQARFNVRVPGVAQDVAEAIAHTAHDICPYSKAVRGNIDVVVNVVGA